MTDGGVGFSRRKLKISRSSSILRDGKMLKVRLLVTLFHGSYFGPTTISLLAIQSLIVELELVLIAYLFSAARIKKSTSKGGKYTTKFKIRCSRYLYTLRIDDPEKAEKLKQSLPPGQSLSLSSSSSLPFHLRFVSFRYLHPWSPSGPLVL